MKTKVYEPATGTSSFEIIWISQASAEQRAGRAGRIGPGHCYRLYSSQIFSSMKQFSTPDILSRPIDEVVLMLKVITNLKNVLSKQIKLLLSSPYGLLIITRYDRQ